jgi:hypothetical protein
LRRYSEQEWFVEGSGLVAGVCLRYITRRDHLQREGAMWVIEQVQHEANGSMGGNRMHEADGGATLTTDRRGVVKWIMENAITSALLKQLIGDQRVDQCVAFQQADGWFVVLAKLPKDRDFRYLATFRQLSKPRRFSRLDVLFWLLHDTLGFSGVIQVLPYSRAGVAKRLEAL